MATVWLALTVILLTTAVRGPGDRIAAHPPRPGHVVGTGVYANEPFMGITNLPLIADIWVFLTALAMYGWYAWRSWTERRFQPMLVMLIVATLVAPIFDPLISWSAYTAYDPRLWHVPETWPLYRILPTVQPLSTLPGYAMFFVSSVVPGLWLHSRLMNRRGPDSFFARRPMLSVFLLSGTLAFAFDSIQAYLATRLEIITYSQIATAAYRSGTTWQSNALWEPLLCLLLFGIAALTVYEDADGNTIATRWRGMSNRPILREFAVSFAVIGLATALYTGGFAMVRLSGAATAVACPWPYQDTHVYDPNGLYAKTCPPETDDMESR